jgi:hypothetical protein
MSGSVFIRNKDTRRSRVFLGSDIKHALRIRAVRLTEKFGSSGTFSAPKNYTQKTGSFGFNFPFNACQTPT